MFRAETLPINQFPIFWEVQAGGARVTAHNGGCIAPKPDVPSSCNPLVGEPKLNKEAFFTPATISLNVLVPPSGIAALFCVHHQTLTCHDEEPKSCPSTRKDEGNAFEGLFAKPIWRLVHPTKAAGIAFGS